MTPPANPMRLVQFPGRLYAITDRRLARLPHDEIVAQLLLGGARTIQIRDKEASPRELLEATRACLRLTAAIGAQLIVNDSVDVALAADADGVHLGQDDTPVDEARARLGKDKIIGLSTHNLDQLHRGLETSADYLAFGPIFGTTTKETTNEVLGLEVVRHAQAIVNRPFVAIGGITLHRAPRVVLAGADAVAVISALYPVPDLNRTDDTREIISRVRALLGALDNAECGDRSRTS